MNYENWKKLAMEVVGRLSWRLWVLGWLFTIGAMAGSGMLWQKPFWQVLWSIVVAAGGWPVTLGALIFAG